MSRSEVAEVSFDSNARDTGLVTDYSTREEDIDAKPASAILVKAGLLDLAFQKTGSRLEE